VHEAAHRGGDATRAAVVDRTGNELEHVTSP
jgi:hypothetical protein